MNADAHALVRAVLAAEAVILAGALLLLLAHAAWLRVRARRWEVPLERGRRALRTAADAGRPARADLEVLRGLPVRLFVRVFAELAPALAGRSRDRLRVLAREVGLAPVAERLCRIRARSDRLRGVGLPTALGGGGGLRDRAWTVRSRTALALRALGSPGVLFLRRALGDEDPFAVVEANGRWACAFGGWEAAVKAAPGVQTVQGEGATGALRGAASLARVVSPGRRVEIAAVGAQAGARRLSPDAADGDYRDFALTLSGAWTF